MRAGRWVRASRVTALAALALAAGCHSENLGTPGGFHPVGIQPKGSADGGGAHDGPATAGDGPYISDGFVDAGRSSGGCGPGATCCGYVVPICPATVPTEGAPCGPVSAFPCEYGDDPRIVCDTLATCTSNGWSVQQPTTDGGYDCATVQPACPPKFSSISDGGVTCSSDEIYQCQYPEGACVCAGAFYCTASLNTCPAKRPRAGTSCADVGSSCPKWGGGCGDGAMYCFCGVWIQSICIEV